MIGFLLRFVINFGNTGCLLCQGEQSTLLSSSLSLGGSLLLVFLVYFLLVKSKEVSMGDSIKPGKVSVGEVSCCSTGSAYLDCQKKQSTSSIS